MVPRQPSPWRSNSMKPTSMMLPGGSPGKRLLANKFGVGLARLLRVEGDEPVETVKENWLVRRGAPKQRQFRHGVAARLLREEKPANRRIVQTSSRCRACRLAARIKSA